MSSTVLKMAPGTAPAVGPDDSTSGHAAQDRRDALALTYQRHDDQYPRVLDVHAEAMAALAAELRGCISLLRGPNDESHFRAAVRCQRGFPLVERTRLILSPRPEALAACQAFDRVAYRERGLFVDWRPLTATGASVAEAVADATEAAAKMSACVLRDLADGRIDSPGAHLDRIAAIKRELGKVEAALLSEVRDRAAVSSGVGDGN